MIDTQKKAVLAAIKQAQEHVLAPLSVPLACEILELDPKTVTIGPGAGIKVSRSGCSIGKDAWQMDKLHALAHLATLDIYPEHGAEFCGNLYHITLCFYPYAAYVLKMEFDRAGIHYTDEHRKRAVIKAVVQRAVDGTSVVEAVFSSPPQRVEGSFRYDRRNSKIIVDEKTFDLERLRYLSRLS